MSAAADFERILLEALDEADDLDCSQQEYREHLGGWINEIKMRIDASKASDPEPDES